MEDKGFEQKEQSEVQGYALSFKWLLTTLIAMWPWFVGSLLLSLLVGNLYLRYAKPVYRISGEVLINDNKTAGSTDENLLQGLGLNTNKSDINNVARSLKSKLIMLQVVDTLHLNVHYVEIGKVKTSELYKSCPFNFVLSTQLNNAINADYEYKVTPVAPDKFVISDKNNKWPGHWGDSISLPLGRVVVSRGIYPIDYKSEYKVHVMPRMSEAASDMGRLVVNVPDKNSNDLDLAFLDEIPERGMDIVNDLVSFYKEMNINDKNMIANNTINFINERLDNVGKELTDVEKDIQNFKESNDLTDIKEQSKLLMESSGDYLKQLSTKQVQLSVIEDLEQYLKNNANNSHATPSASLLSDPSVTQLMARYNALQVERGHLLLSNTESNPVVVNIDQQLAGLRSDMLGSLASAKNSLIVTVNELKRQEGSLDQEIRTVPVKERVYLEYSRKQAVKQDIFLFLLKKREDAAVSKLSTVANVTFLDGAINNGAVSPNRSRVLMLSLLIGLLIPSAVIYLRKTLNNTIITKQDITSNTNIPLLGEIGHYNNKAYVAVKRNDTSVISEQFRALRTNLQFFLPDKDNKIILLTSSMSGEGKSFVAVNVAITFAISGKRVVLMELDLRKPKISKKLGLENKVGFSTYAIGQAEISDIIQPSGIDDNLFVISSGPIPPNPAELIMLPKMDTLFATLRDNFDYIIVDTSPIGLVIDAQLLNKHADATLYLVRQGYTYKQQLQIINDLKQSEKLPKISLVINDVEHKRGFTYGYGYGYEYGYGYKYGYSYGNYGTANGNGKQGTKKSAKKLS